MDQKLRGGLFPFGGPHLTQCGQGRAAEAYLHTQWHLDPSTRLATTNMGRKLGAAVPPFEGGSGSPPYLTQWSGLGPDLPPYQVAS